MDVKGEILELKNTINTMVDQLNAFAGEVTRVAREVGTDGRLGGQAAVPGVAGTWKDLTDNVNLLAANLTTQVRNIAEVTTAIANGDLSKKITVNVSGEILQLKETLNTMVDQLNAFASEVSRVARGGGTGGRRGGQATVPGAANKVYDSPEVTAWSQAVDACDGFIFVTPEYNHSVPGAFKNAFDSLGSEWGGKTVAFVSYGAESGVRAVEHWRQIVSNFSMVDVRQQVSVSRFVEFGPDGFTPNDRRADEFQTLLGQLLPLTAKLRG